MRELAVTAVGHDRPGIVAAVTGALASVGGNLEDSSMTLLGGHFAMMLLVACDAEPHEVEAALAPVAAELGLLTAVGEVPAEEVLEPAGSHHVVTVHGADRPGIVARVSGVVAAHGGNVTDMSTRLTGDLYVVVLELDLPAGTGGAAEALAGDLATAAAELGVAVSLRPADADVL